MAVMRKSLRHLSVFAGLLSLSLAATSPAAPSPAQLDRDLLEVTIPQLQEFYRARKYTVTQVVQWHLARIHRYNGVYRAVETVMESAALATAAREDKEATAASHGLLWGVP